MNLPFESEKEPEWKPRNHLGRADSLTTLEKQFLDAMDILEQRQDRTSKLAVTTYNRFLILACVVGLLVVLHGGDILKIIRGWIGGVP